MHLLSLALMYFARVNLICNRESFHSYLTSIESMRERSRIFIILPLKRAYDNMTFRREIFRLCCKLRELCLPSRANPKGPAFSLRLLAVSPDVFVPCDWKDLRPPFNPSFAVCIRVLRKSLLWLALVIYCIILVVVSRCFLYHRELRSVSVSDLSECFGLAFSLLVPSPFSRPCGTNQGKKERISLPLLFYPVQMSRSWERERMKEGLFCSCCWRIDLAFVFTSYYF